MKPADLPSWRKGSPKQHLHNLLQKIVGETLHQRILILIPPQLCLLPLLWPTKAQHANTTGGGGCTQMWSVASFTLPRQWTETGQSTIHLRHRLRASSPCPATPNARSSQDTTMGGTHKSFLSLLKLLLPWLLLCPVLQVDRALTAARTRWGAGWGRTQQLRRTKGAGGVHSPQKPTRGIMSQNIVALIPHYPEPSTATYSCITATCGRLIIILIRHHGDPLASQVCSTEGFAQWANHLRGPPRCVSARLSIFSYQEWAALNSLPPGSVFCFAITQNLM